MSRLDWKLSDLVEAVAEVREYFLFGKWLHSFHSVHVQCEYAKFQRVTTSENRRIVLDTHNFKVSCCGLAAEADLQAGGTEVWYLHAAVCVQDAVSGLYFDFEVCLLQVFFSDCASISASVHFQSDVCCIIQLGVDEDLVDDLGGWLLAVGRQLADL